MRYTFIPVMIFISVMQLLSSLGLIIDYSFNTFRIFEIFIAFFALALMISLYVKNKPKILSIVISGLMVFQNQIEKVFNIIINTDRENASIRMIDVKINTSSTLMQLLIFTVYVFMIIELFYNSNRKIEKKNA